MSINDAIIDISDGAIGGNPFPAIIDAKEVVKVAANAISFRDLNNSTEDANNPFVSIAFT